MAKNVESTKKQPVESSPEQGFPEGKLEKIREILFGAQLHELKTQMQALEQRLLSRVAEIEREHTRRWNDLDQLVTKQIEALTDNYGDLHNNQNKALSLIEKTRADAQHTALNQENRYAKEFSEISDRLTEQGGEFVDKLDELRQELMAALASESARLQDNQACRDALGAMLTDLASRLESDKEARRDTGPHEDR